MIRAFLTLIFFLQVLSLQAKEADVVFLPPGKCYFFMENYYTGAAFVGLLSTGEYLRINREHMGTFESDRGKWIQDEDGQVQLQSNNHFHDVVVGGLSLGFYGEDTPENVVPRVKAGLRYLLQQDLSKKEFKVSDVQRVRDLSIDAEVEFETKVVPRKDIEELLTAVEVYEKASDQKIFRFIPLSYSDTTFIEWQNDGISVERDRRLLMEEIDKAGENAFPDFTYVAISKEVFEREAGTTQPFLFYPEMNQEGRDPEAKPRVTAATAKCP